MMEAQVKEDTTFTELSDEKDQVISSIIELNNIESVPMSPHVAYLNVSEPTSDKECIGIEENDRIVHQDNAEVPNGKTGKKLKLRLKRNKLKKTKKSSTSSTCESENVSSNDQLLSKLSSSIKKQPKWEYPRLCPGCSHLYKTKQSFWNHKQRCALLPENIARNNAVNGNLDDKGDKVVGQFKHRLEYVCANCDRRYRKKCNLRAHLENMCRGRPGGKGRLQCWEDGCTQAFYKYVDLVAHVTMQHKKDLEIKKLQFPNFTAFNTWKTEESNSKFMYARKITGSKRFSNTKYHYFVCQFNHRNEKKNNIRKTSRRKKECLVVPNYNCPSRIMVKECENQVTVTYISSHNHDLNLSNVKYQPLEKETRAYIKKLLSLGVNPNKIIAHLKEGSGHPEIDSFLTTKQHFITLGRIKRMESKMKAKNKIPELKNDTAEIGDLTTPSDVDPVGSDNSFGPCETSFVSNGTSSVTATSVPVASSSNADSHSKDASAGDDVVRSIENNLRKLKSYVHRSGIRERLSDRISKMIQELCDECENIDSAVDTAPSAPKKRTSASRKRKTAVSHPVAMVVPSEQISQVSIAHPTTVQHQTLQPIMIQYQAATSLQAQLVPHQTIEATFDQSRLVTGIVTNVTNVTVHNEDLVRNEKSFTPAVNETTNLLETHYQPFNINLLCLKSLDRYISDREESLIKTVDPGFERGWLYEAVVNSFTHFICQSLGNVIVADSNVTEYVETQQKVPEMWHCYNWNDIDTIFIPCNSSKRYWILLVLLVKQSELQILDPTDTYDTIKSIYEKHSRSINCWYNVVRNFLGVQQCNVTSPAHTKRSDPADSGVLVCWYVFQYIHKRNLADNMDSDVFRQYMFNHIINNSTQVQVAS